MIMTDMEEIKLSRALRKAALEYLNYCYNVPKQLNIQRIKINEDFDWVCEYTENAGEWTNCTPWESDEKKVLELFFSSDACLLDIEDWNE